MTLHAIVISERTIDKIKETELASIADLANMLEYQIETPVFYYDTEKQKPGVKVWAVCDYQHLYENYQVDEVGFSEKFVTLSPKRPVSSKVVVEAGDYLNTKFDMPVGYELTEDDHTAIRRRG